MASAPRVSVTQAEGTMVTLALPQQQYGALIMRCTADGYWVDTELHPEGEEIPPLPAPAYLQNATQRWHWFYGLHQRFVRGEMQSLAQAA